MKRKTLKQTKAEALQKLGTLKTKVKDTLKTRTKNVSILPSISKLTIASKAFMIKTLWLDKISGTVVATYVKLLRTTFGIIIKANLILAVIIYITQILGVEHSFTYDLYIYLALFIYYFFKDSLLDYSDKLFELIKSIFKKLFSNLHEVKDNVDIRNSNKISNNNVTTQAKNSYRVLKDSGKLEDIQPKHTDSDWSKTIMIIAAVCFVAFCFYCYDPDNFKKVFNFIGATIWAIPNRLINAIKAIPAQISFLYKKIFKGGDGDNNGSGGSAPAGGDLNPATNENAIDTNNANVNNEDPADPNNPLTFTGVIQSIRRQAREHINQRRNRGNRVDNTEIRDPATRPDNPDSTVTPVFDNPSNVQNPNNPLPWPQESETPPDWLQIGAQRIEEYNARAHRPTVEVGVGTEAEISTSETQRLLTNIQVLPAHIGHRLNRLNRDRDNDNTTGSGDITPTPSTPTPQTQVLPQTNVEAPVPNVQPQDPLVDPALDYTQSLQRRLEALGGNQTTQTTANSGSNVGNTPSSSSTVTDTDTQSVAESNPSTITGFINRLRRSSSSGSNTETSQRFPRSHRRRGGRGGN